MAGLDSSGLSIEDSSYKEVKDTCDSNSGASESAGFPKESFTWCPGDIVEPVELVELCCP